MAASYLTFASGKNAGGSSENIPDFTVSIPGGHSNLAAAVVVAWSIKTASGVSVSVGGQAASLIANTQIDGIAYRMAIYGVALGNTSGDKTVSISWTGSCVATATVVIAENVHQTTPLNNGAGAMRNNEAASQFTLSLTGTSDGVTVAGAALESGEAVTGCGETEIYNDRAQFTIGFGVAYATAEVSPTHGWYCDLNRAMELTGANFQAVAGGIYPANGEQSPTGPNEVAVPWSSWKHETTGTAVTVSGSADWGKIEVVDGAPVVSPVTDMGSAASRTFTITCPSYGTNEGTATYWIRGSTTAFALTDASPSWEQYTAPITRTWQYVQVKLVYAS